MKGTRGMFAWSVVAGLGVLVACGGQARDRSQKIGDGPPVGGQGGAGGIASAGGGFDTGSAGAGGRKVGLGTGGTGIGTGSTSGQSGAVGAGGRVDIDAGPTCMPLALPSPCDWGIACVEDFRTVRSRFPACGQGPSGMPAVGRCGAYDVVFVTGIDSGTQYFFDHSDGHFLGLVGYGLDAGVCQSSESSFVPPTCDYPPICPVEDGGGGSFVRDCNREEPEDAGAPPAFCPMPGSPRPVLGSKPRPGLDQQSMTVKFVEGSHVRMSGSQLEIDPLGMLDEDPGLLRCAHLTVPGATCELERLQSALYARYQPIIARVFTTPEAELDRMRADGRASSGMYLDDENLFYTVQAPTAQLSGVYDLFARSPVVDTVYWDPTGLPASP